MSALAIICLVLGGWLAAAIVCAVQLGRFLADPSHERARR